MSGVIWRTPSGEIGPEIGRRRINGVIVVAVLLPRADGLPDWRSRSEHHPIGDLVELQVHETRYGGANGGRG